MANKLEKQSEIKNDKQDKFIWVKESASKEIE